MNIKKSLFFATLLVSLAVLPAACGTTPPPAVNNTPEIQYVVVTATPPSVTNTPDPCAAENLEAEVQKVHAYMREFDDAASLAGNIMQGIGNGQMQMSDLSNTVPNLQRVRRDAENQITPSCLVTLKTYQINHMNTVLNSLSAFLSGDQQGFDQNVMSARQFHDAYTLELARVLGIPIETVATAIPSQAPTP